MQLTNEKLYELCKKYGSQAKLCGLSVGQVRLALNLEKRFENKPTLKKMLANGEASINKLTRIVSIATPDNEEELAEKVKVLPKRALDTLVRDVKEIKVGENMNGLQKPLFDDKSLPGQTLTFHINDDVVEELNELHSKGIDVNELLREEYGTKCSIATCNKPATIIHHTQRLSLSHNHDPKFLIPLCSEHHIIVHSIDVKYHQAREFAIQ